MRRHKVNVRHSVVGILAFLAIVCTVYPLFMLSRIQSFEYQSAGILPLSSSICLDEQNHKVSMSNKTAQICTKQCDANDYNVANNYFWMQPRERKTIAICTMVVNEEAYLDEFVDYHLALGFDGIYVYDNSEDFELRQWGTEKDCRIKVKHYPGTAKQMSAFTDCAKFAQRDGHTWAAFIDADEILILKKDKDIHPFVEKHCKEGSLGINWVVFGTGGRLLYSPQPMTKRFQYRSKNYPHDHVKSIARIADMDLNRDQHAHHPYLKPGFSQHDTKGKKFSGFSNRDGPIDEAVIFHYWHKSRKEYVYKRMRGRATTNWTVGNVDGLIQMAKSGVVIDAPIFDDLAWRKMKEYVPKYAFYDVIFPDPPQKPS